jgi:hypothetical protein
LIREISDALKAAKAEEWKPNKEAGCYENF